MRNKLEKVPVEIFFQTSFSVETSFSDGSSLTVVGDERHR